MRTKAQANENMNAESVISAFRELAKTSPGALYEIGKSIAGVTAQVEAERKHAEEESQREAEREKEKELRLRLHDLRESSKKLDSEMREREAERIAHPEIEQNAFCNVLSVVGKKNELSRQNDQILKKDEE